MIVTDRQIGLCRMILGDMRAVLPGLGLRADLVLSDPPYLLSAGGRSGKMGGIFARDRYDNGGALFPIVDWSDMAPEIYRACARDADAIIMCNDKNLVAAQLAFEAAGFDLHRILVWDRQTVTPGRWFMSGLEFGLYLWRGRARPINDAGAHPLFRLPHRDQTDHPTEKPVALMQRWIELTTDPGDLVLDPFAGSGASLVAAVRAGRRAVGIEVDPRWYDVACARIAAAQACAQGNLALIGGGA